LEDALLPRRFVLELDLEPLVENRELTQPLRERIEVDLDQLEDVWIRMK
jgi:hypothetical protein